jgi:hypothetical protein
MRFRGILLSAVAVLSVTTAVRSQAPPPKPQAPRAPAAKPTPAPPPVLEGIVRGPDRKPIEQALVLAIAGRSARGAFSVNEPAPASTRTDAAGRFRLPLRTREPHTVRVESPGLAAATRRDVVAGTPLAFDLTAGGVIQGTVRDGDTGAPVAGIRVVGTQNDAIAAPATPDAGRVVTRTDANGRFELAGLANGRFALSAGGRGRGVARRQSVRVGSRLDLVLFPSGSIVGTVLGDDGRPVPGAVVSAAAGMWGAGGTEPVDARGAYEIHGLAPASYDVIAHAPGLAPTVVAGVTIERRTDAPVDLVLRPGARVVGRLVDGDDRAVAGQVALGELDGRSVPRALVAPFTVEAGADGRFAIDGVPVGAHVLGVNAPALARQRVDVRVRAAERQVDVGDVRLEVGTAIRGRVRSKARQPIADAAVRTYLEKTGDSVEARSEPDGKFVLPGLEPGTYRVVAEAAGYGTEERTSETNGDPLELVLSPAGVITGRAVDDHGQPLEAFTVVADTGGDFGADRRTADLSESSSDDGSFRLSNVPAGRYALVVSAPQRLSATVPDVAVAEGQVVDVGTVKLAAGGVVRGTAVDPSGGPVSGASIYASMRPQAGRAPGWPGEVTTDAAGDFELKGLTPGRVEIGAYHPNHAPADRVAVDVDLAKPVTDVRLVLPRGGRIEGAVRNRDGSGRAGLLVSASPSQPGRIVMTPSAFLSTTTAADGTFALDHVLSGQATVTAMEPGDRNARSTRTVEVRESATTTVEIVEREILLSGRVTRSGGPAGGLRLEAVSAQPGGAIIRMGAPADATGLQRLSAVTREDGSFEMTLGAPGRYSIGATVVEGSLRLASRGIDVPDADTYAVELAYDGVRVTGSVVDGATNVAVPNAMVQARSREAGTGSYAQTGLDGCFQMELEPAEYSFTAIHRSGGYRPAETTAVVGTSGLSDVRLAMPKGLTISGIVRQPNGQPAYGVSVQAIPAADDRFAGDGNATSRADGAFEIGGLLEGVYTVIAQRIDGAFAQQQGVRTGERVSLALRAGGRLAVIVREKTGAPVPNASAIVSQVDGTPAGGMSPSETTDAQGRAEFFAPAGALTVYAVKNGQSERNGSTSVTLAPGGTATATIELSDGSTPAH